MRRLSPIKFSWRSYTGERYYPLSTLDWQTQSQGEGFAHVSDLPYQDTGCLKVNHVRPKRKAISICEFNL